MQDMKSQSIKEGDCMSIKYIFTLVCGIGVICVSGWFMVIKNLLIDKCPFCLKYFWIYRVRRNDKLYNGKICDYYRCPHCNAAFLNLMQDLPPKNLGAD